MKKLNERQKRFCQEYLKDLNGKQAAIRSGYSAKTAEVQASKLLRNPKVSEYLQGLMDKRAKKVELTAESILESIIEVRERCMQKEPVMVKRDGEYVQDTETDAYGEEQGIWKFDASNALKANELLGKHLRLFTEKMEVSGNLGVTIEDDV